MQLEYPKQIVDSVTNTKKATVLLTLGYQPREGGAVFIIYDKEAPKSTGGQAHFLFQSSIANDVQRALEVYDAGAADAELDHFLDAAELRSPELSEFVKELRPVIRHALIANGRKFLDNYQCVLRDLRNDIAKYVKIGGTPVFDKKGRYIGQQNFSIQRVKE